MGIRKCGAVYEKPLSEWFNAYDTTHLRGWACHLKTGSWPPGFFAADDVWEDWDWERRVAEKVGDLMPDVIKNWAEEYGRVLAIVEAIKFPGYERVVEPLNAEFVLQARPSDRRWLFPAGQTTGKIVQTALKAILTSVEERTREVFTYRGKPVPVLELID